MTTCLFFIKTFYNYKTKCRFYKGVKYRLKKVDNNHYYTIYNSKFPKSYENHIFKVVECV